MELLNKFFSWKVIFAQQQQFLKICVRRDVCGYVCRYAYIHVNGIYLSTYSVWDFQQDIKYVLLSVFFPPLYTNG